METQKVLDEVANLNALHKNERLGGEFINLSNDAYHHFSGPALSRSDLVLARRSMHHLIAKKAGKLEKEPSAAMEFGTMFHDFILEPELFEENYTPEYEVPKPDIDGRTKEGKAAKAEWSIGYAGWLKSVEGKKIVSKDDLYKIHAMKAGMYKNDLVRDIFEGGQAEFENSYYYQCPIFNKTMKFRPDIIMKEQKIMIDLKTAADASPNSFRKSMVNFYYDLQAAQYCHGASVLMGGDWTFAYLVAEKTEPFGVALYTAGQAEKDMGMEIYKDTAKIFQKEESKLAYGDKFQDIGLPAWGFDLSNR